MLPFTSVLCTNALVFYVKTTVFSEFQKNAMITIARCSHQK